jgi:type IV secretory pathway VirD2 relaxase
MRSGIDVQRPGADARRVVVKAHVARLGPGGAKAASLHLRYIQRDGVEKDGSQGVLYDAGGPARPRAFEQPRVGERHQFRLIVSPEDAGELDLTDYVRRLMTRVERDLGRRLEWAAVNHYNTDHPHAHVIIRGVDRDGSEVRLDRGYISNGLRWRAQEIATEELGPRQELDVRRAHTKEVTQERFTSLDRELERRIQDDRVQVRSSRPPGRVDESTLIGRLEHLERLRLAERLSPKEWMLTQGWQQTLRDLGSSGDIIKQIHAAISGDPARYHVVRAGQAMQTDPTDAPVVTGRVASKGLSDELKGAFYAVIETPTGRAYHVPLDARSAEALRLGDIVSLTTKPEAPVRPVDRHIADVAGKRHGVYEVEPDPAPDAQRAARRMRDLERLGLATAAGPNRWTIAPNLLEELERRRRDAPARHRLLMHKQPLSLQAQVQNPGPVWLDRIDTASLAPYGLGAEVHRAIERRRNALRHIGIAPDDPNRFTKLRELERRYVAKDVATTSGQSFVANTPNSFRGRVVGTRASPTGSSYTLVSDGERFVLLKTTASLRVLPGKVVTLSRDAKGRVVAREAPDRGLER